MEILGLLTGWDQDKAACNAVMASHLLESMESSTKTQIARLLGERLVECRLAKTPEAALAHISKSCRVTQMNFISNACKTLSIQPLLRDGVGWREVQNPFAVGGRTKERDISATIRFMQKQNPAAKITWPGDDEAIDFTKWYN